MSRKKRCNQCKKSVYLTEEDAVRGALVTSQTWGTSPEIVGCPFGHGFHLMFGGDE